MLVLPHCTGNHAAWRALLVGAVLRVAVTMATGANGHGDGPIESEDRGGEAQKKRRLRPPGRFFSKVFCQPHGSAAASPAFWVKVNPELLLITPPEVANMGPGVYRGSGGGARGCGFEERVGVHARTGGIHFRWPFRLRACNH